MTARHLEQLAEAFLEQASGGDLLAATIGEEPSSTVEVIWRDALEAKSPESLQLGMGKLTERVVVRLTEHEADQRRNFAVAACGWCQGWLRSEPWPLKPAAAMGVVEVEDAANEPPLDAKEPRKGPQEGHRESNGEQPPKKMSVRQGYSIAEEGRDVTLARARALAIVASACAAAGEHSGATMLAEALLEGSAPWAGTGLPHSYRTLLQEEVQRRLEGVGLACRWPEVLLERAVRVAAEAARLEQRNDQFGACLVMESGWRRPTGEHAACGEGCEESTGVKGLNVVEERGSEVQQEDRENDEQFAAEESEGDILAVGWNHKYSDPTKRNAGMRVVHAEVHALAQLLQQLPPLAPNERHQRLRGLTIVIVKLDPLGCGYGPGQPCPLCNKALCQVGIGRVIYSSAAGLCEACVPCLPEREAESLDLALLAAERGDLQMYGGQLWPAAAGGAAAGALAPVVILLVGFV